MKLSFFKKPAGQDVESPYQSDTFQALRVRILNNLLIVASIVGLILYFFEIFQSFRNNPRPVILIVSSLLVIWLLVITFFRKLSYLIRAISLTTLVYGLAVLSLVQGGVTTSGAILLLAFVFIATLFVGPWGAMASSISAVGSAVIIGFLMSRRVLVPTGIQSSDSAFAWISLGAAVLVLCTSIGMSMSIVLRDLQKNLKNATLIAGELEKDRADLRQHSQDLERRSIQIRTAAGISRSISGVLATEKLLQESVDLILKGFNLYYVGVFLLDETERNAVLQAGTGEAGKAMLAEHHKLPVAESSMIGWTVIHRQARIALDVGEEAVRFANPHLPDTHSEVALPLISGDKVLGALSIQSSQVRAFDQDDISVLQNISDTLAIALENAHLFQETQSTLEELRNTQRAYMTRAWTEINQEQDEYDYTAPSASGGTPGEGAAIDVPLTLREQIIGQLHLEGDQEWTPEEQSLIEAVASQTALALENARLLQESQQAALRERIVTEISGKVWSSPNTDYILQTAIKELARALHADDATIELNTD